MKTYLRLLGLLLPALVLTSCLEETCDAQLTFIGYEPVVVSEVEFRVDIAATDPLAEVCEPSGFYIYDQYLMVVDRNKGLHIIDNSEPTAPNPVSFLPVGGAVGLAVRNNILYINNYTDLLAFDLSSPRAPQMISRTEDVFQPYGIFTNDLGNQGLIVDYIETEQVRFIDCTDPRGRSNVFWDGDIAFVNRASNDFAIATSESSSGNNTGGGEQVGIGGSLARFTIANGTLYAVDESQLKTFGLANPSEPDFQGNVQLDWGVETIFPSGDELYIGTNTGMHIMNIDDPLNPILLATMEHVRACDPVVVNDGLAYVTLRGGTFCGGFTNQLEIVDVSNPSNPERLETYPMQGPVGLSVSDSKLFVCEPDYSFKVYDLQENGMLGELLTTDDELMHGRDVIGLPWLDQLIVIGTEGVEQLAYDERGNLSKLSKIEICTDL